MKSQTGYYAVIFSAKRSADDDGYGEMASKMETLAKTMPGYLGFEAACNPDGFEIAVSYWETEEDIAHWKHHQDHLEAQRRGQLDWYEFYDVRVAKVERAYNKTTKPGDN